MESAREIKDYNIQGRRPKKITKEPRVKLIKEIKLGINEVKTIKEILNTYLELELREKIKIWINKKKKKDQIKDESSQHGIKRKKSYEPLEVEDQVSLKWK